MEEVSIVFESTFSSNPISIQFKSELLYGKLETLPTIHGVSLIIYAFLYTLILTYEYVTSKITSFLFLQKSHLFNNICDGFTEDNTCHQFEPPHFISWYEISNAEK